MKINDELKKALKIGSVCIFSYLASYYMRHLLSVCSPEMLSEGQFNKEIIGTLSSVYFLVYALGQLVNGVIGDKVKAKYMVFAGLSACGVASVIFAGVTVFAVQLIVFAMMGFALSMLRGPLVKTISENTLPKYARTCCVFLSFSSFAGPLIASLLSLAFNWKLTFIVAGLSCVIIAFAAYVILTILEKQGAVLSVSNVEKKEKKSFFQLFKLENFVFYMSISALVDISGSSITFWLPTYLTEKLSFSEATAGIIFSGISLVRSFVPFAALIIIKYFKDDVKLARSLLFIAALFFAGVRLVANPYLNVACFLLAAVSMSFVSALIWSIYIPSQGKTGMVSTMNGVLDCTGYLAASAANMVFALAIDKTGWNGVVLMWVVLMAAGGVFGLCAGKKSNMKKFNGV